MIQHDAISLHILSFLLLQFSCPQRCSDFEGTMFHYIIVYYMVFRNNVVHTVRWNNKQVRFDSGCLRFWFLIQLSVQYYWGSTVCWLCNMVSPLVTHLRPECGAARRAHGTNIDLEHSEALSVEEATHKDDGHWWSIFIYIHLIEFRVSEGPQ